MSSLSDSDMSTSSVESDTSKDVLEGTGTSARALGVNDTRSPKQTTGFGKEKTVGAKLVLDSKLNPSFSKPSLPSSSSTAAQFTFGARENASPSKKSPAKGAIRRHEKYYFADGKMNVSIQGILFKIHQSILDMHSVRPWWITSTMIEQSSEKPIELRDTTIIEFERFLSVVYPPVLGETKAMSVEEWTTVLKLATRWKMDRLRNAAVKALSSLTMPPVDRIALWKRFSLPSSQLHDAYSVLCSRTEPLTLNENLLLGMETVTLLATAREQYIRGPPASNTPAWLSTTEADKKSEYLKEVVFEVFAVA